MSGERAGKAVEDTAYAYRSSMFGAAREFRLTGDGIEWTAGRRSGQIPFPAVRRLRMSFKPANMQWQRFLTEVWADGAPKLEIVSTSWKSMVEQERLDKSYTAFVTELHRRIALAAVPARFERGRSPFLYWPSLTVFAGVALVAAALIVRALQSDAKGGAAFIAGFLVLFLWQGGNFFRRNRPGLYRPDALPAELMPKG
jgi:uncharacterized membrane protein YgdD (TMEM256/DUF423 family)